MPDNIVHSEYKEGKLFITRRNARILLEDLKDELPESSMLEDLDVSIKLPEVEKLEIENPWWNGSGSGYGYPETLTKVLKETTGKATIVFVWEGGDSITAVKVNEGKVSFPKAKIVVEEE